MPTSPSTGFLSVKLPAALVQQAQTASQTYEAAARKTRLDDIEARFAAANQSGHLADRVREGVLDNRAKAAALKKAV